MAPIVLLVTAPAQTDQPSPLVETVEREATRLSLTVALQPRGDVALAWLEGRLDGDLAQAPVAAVVDVDVVKGWNVCALLKKAAPGVPVLVVSHKFGAEVFAEHQKLETRADGYHRLPAELEQLAAALGQAIAGAAPAEGGRAGSEPRNTSRAQRADAALSRLEQRALEQEREIERLRQTIEALEVERDAVAENARRQLAQRSGDEGAAAGRSRPPSGVLPPPPPPELGPDDLLPPPPPPEFPPSHDDGDAPPLPPEPVHDEDLMAELEATRSELQARELAWASERAVLAVEAARGREGSEAAEDEARRTAESAADELARASEQLGNLAVQFAGAHRERVALRADKLRLEGRVSALEAEVVALIAREGSSPGLAAAGPSASSGLLATGSAAPPPLPGEGGPELAARLAEVEGRLAERERELEQLHGARRDAEHALATSRKLMREYASEASRKAEELREATAHVLELEEALEAAVGHVGVLEAQVEAMSAAAPPPPEPSAVSLELELAELRQTLAAAIVTHTQELEEARAEGDRKVAAALAEGDVRLSAAAAEADGKLAAALAEADGKVARLTAAHAELEGRLTAAAQEAGEARGRASDEAHLAHIRAAWGQLVEEFGAVLGSPPAP